MLKLFALSSFLVASAVSCGYGGGCGNAGAHIGGLVGVAPAAAALAYTPGNVYGGLVYAAAPAAVASVGSLATHTNQHVNYVDTPNQGYVYPTSVNVDSQPAPINLMYRTISSPVNIRHHHSSAAGSFRQTESVDEPHRHLHTVTKPIIQELREIITPQRIVRQQVQPVQEEIQTQVARQAGSNANGGAAGAGAGNGGGNGGNGANGANGGSGLAGGLDNGQLVLGNAGSVGSVQFPLTFNGAGGVTGSTSAQLGLGQLQSTSCSGNGCGQTSGRLSSTTLVDNASLSYVGLGATTGSAGTASGAAAY